MQTRYMIQWLGKKIPLMSFVEYEQHDWVIFCLMVCEYNVLVNICVDHKEYALLIKLGIREIFPKFGANIP